MIPPSPCRDRTTNTDCPMRSVGCAATCPEWEEYVKVRNREYERRRTLSDSNHAAYNISSRRWSRGIREKIRQRKFKQG